MVEDGIAERIASTPLNKIPVYLQERSSKMLGVKVPVEMSENNFKACIMYLNNL